MNTDVLAKFENWKIDACGLLVCLAVTAAVWLVGIAPLRKQQDDAAARRQEMSEKSQESTRAAAQLRQLTAQLVNVRKQTAQVTLDLQPATRINQRLAQVTAAASECGLEVNDVRPGRAIVGTRHTIVPIEMSGTGSYPSAVQFIRRLHKTFGDSGVASFELAGSPANPGTPASFHFRLHWFGEPHTASAECSPGVGAGKGFPRTSVR